MTRLLPAAAAALILVAAPALAQQGHPPGHAMDHAGGHGQMAKQDYLQAMQRMHQAMMGAEDPDPDRAFALKMIEHHRGGIAMAEVLEKHGDDAELKAMARKSAEMQRKEIGELQAWLGRHGGAPRK
ncbi:DUF305 domain-containing protein [uncultured Caulobacter sp.]|uniref:DUF305 domain-containing protein n=1 Tax=uncultured Caulobacter sp. TaxID=158749 RepID=UPI002616AA28|nr:DUF305 domain-containing protein [uncultured Caulobacter sp.]